VRGRRIFFSDLALRRFFFTVFLGANCPRAAAASLYQLYSLTHPPISFLSDAISPSSPLVFSLPVAIIFPPKRDLLFLGDVFFQSFSLCYYGHFLFECDSFLHCWIAYPASIPHYLLSFSRSLFGSLKDDLIFLNPPSYRTFPCITSLLLLVCCTSSRPGREFFFRFPSLPFPEEFCDTSFFFFLFSPPPFQSVFEPFSRLVFEYDGALFGGSSPPTFHNESNLLAFLR